MAAPRTLPQPDQADVVTFTIKVDGEELSRSIQVNEIMTLQEVNRIPVAKITILDGDPASQEFPVSNQDLFIPGNEIEIHAGYSSEEELIFKGIVIKHSLRARRDGKSYLTIECRDPAVLMTLHRKSHYFVDMTDSDIVEEIFSSYGVTTDITSTEVTHEKVVQFDAADWDFALSRLEANGHICIVNGGTIATAPPDFEQEPALVLQYGATILEFDTEMDARDQTTAVKGYSWDYASQEIIESEGEDPGITEGGNLSASDIAGSLGQERRWQHSGFVNEAELQAWTNAKRLKCQMAKIRGRVKFQGNSGVKAGNLITLAGVGERFTGDAFVSAVRHHVSKGTWHTDVQIGINPKWFAQTYPIHHALASNMLPAVQGLQIGLVTQLQEDPNGEHRILVRLPIIDPDAEGIWARVAALDAGENRGALFLPEIDDEVVVGFLNNDPREAVVLGMLHSSAKPVPDAFTVSDDNPQKGLVTRSGIKALFDDETTTYSIETPNGNQLRMSEDSGSIEIKDENGNEIILNADGIKLVSAADITLEASGDIKATGTNVELEGSAGFTGKGSSTAELSSDGTTTIKGGTVMIN